MIKRNPLPIDELEADFRLALSSHSQFIIHAPTGAGKSTRVPLWLMQWCSLRKEHHKIYLIQPRRIAAASIARQLASQLNEVPGHQVGLRTRFDRITSNHTRIEVMTEGMFIRFIQENPGLEGVAAVVFDEFHERSLQLDLGLAFAIDCQREFRDPSDPLKLVIMSATLAAEQLRMKLDSPYMLKSEGRAFPVETSYHPISARDTALEVHVALIIALFLEKEAGSALVFLPGMKQIKEVQRLVEKQNWGSAVLIVPLHASLSPAQQSLAVSASSKGVRKIVLSTNVAETSLTIEGITAVIDAGLARVSFFDRNRGMSQLRTQMISQASADQRQGRAGRLGPGKCYRLWSKETQQRLQKYEIPQILSDDLASTYLEMKLWGESNLHHLFLLDYPKDHAIEAAQTILRQLGGLDTKDRISKRGELMAKMGVSPRLAAMCLAGKDSGTGSVAASLAVILNDGGAAQAKRDSDIMTPLRSMIDSDRRPHSADSSVKNLLKLSKQLFRRLSTGQPFGLPKIVGPDDLLLTAFPDRIAKQRSLNGRRYLLSSGREVQLHPSDTLFNHPWLIVLDHSSDAIPFIYLAAVISGAYMADHIASHAESIVKTSWDESKAAAVAVERLMLGKIVVREQQVAASSDKVADILLNVVRDSRLSCLDLTGFEQWQARVSWLAANSDLNIGKTSITDLICSMADWLPPYLAGARTLADLKKIALLPVVLNQMEWSLRQKIDVLAPLSIVLPTGSMRKIHYEFGSKPSVSVKIQEVFGLKDSPTINSGKNNLLLELLSPASRPVQRTDDLKSFWASTYPELCKEMKGRYPKHYWPASPDEAQATNRTKKNMRQ